MKTSIKQAEQISLKYEQLKKLDSEVIKLERLCEDILEREIGGEIAFKIAKKKKKGEGVLDEDGSLITSEIVRDSFFGLRDFAYNSPTRTEEAKNTTEFTLRDYELLNCLGAILNIKMAERNQLLKEIETFLTI